MKQNQTVENHVSTLISDEEKQPLYSSLFESVDAYHLLNISNASYTDSSTYGEIEFNGFSELLSKLTIANGAVFLDLGTGIGKALVAASLLQPFSTLIGVESFRPFVESSQDALHRFEAMLKDKGIEQLPVFQSNEGLIEQTDFSEADVIFAHSTCFSEALIQDIQRKSVDMKQGAVIIMTTHTLDSDYLTNIHSGSCSMSWGEATVTMYERI